MVNPWAEGYFWFTNNIWNKDGDFSWYGYTFIQYDEVYYGCLAVTRGFTEEGIDCFNRVYNSTNKSPWNIGLTYLTDGSFSGLPYYMTNPASLFILEALSGWLPNAVDGTIRFAPHNGGEALSIPLFSPRVWVRLEHLFSQSEEKYEISVLRTIGKPCFHTLLLESDNEVRQATLNGRDLPFSKQGNQISISCEEALCKYDVIRIVLNLK